MSRDGITTPEEFLQAREDDEQAWAQGPEQGKARAERIEQLCEGLQGHLCKFPLEFLKDQRLGVQASMISRSIVPL